MAMGSIGMTVGLGMSSSENLGLIYKRILFYHKRGDIDNNSDLNAVVDDFVSFSADLESDGELITLTPSYPYYSDGIRGIVYDGEQFTLFVDISFYLNHALSILSPGYIVDVIISSNDNHLSGDFPYYSDVLCNYRIIFQIDMSNFKLIRSSLYSNLNNFLFTNDLFHFNGVSVNNINSTNFDLSNLKDCGIKVDIESITLDFIIASQIDFSCLDNYVNQFKLFMLDDKSKNIRFKRHLNPMKNSTYLVNIHFIDMDIEFSRKYLDEFLNKLEASINTFKRRGLKIIVTHNIDGYTRSSELFNSLSYFG